MQSQTSQAGQQKLLAILALTQGRHLHQNML